MQDKAAHETGSGRTATMGWNVLATAKDHEQSHLAKRLKRLGDFRWSPYLGVLIGRVEDHQAFFDQLRRNEEVEPGYLLPLARVVPLEKTLTKRIWRDRGLPTARFQEFTSSEDPLDPDLRFPLFVKPAREGTGMGIDLAAVSKDEGELRARVAWVLSTYRQPALVEEFLPGREFTVGYIGNSGVPLRRRRPWLYDANGYHFFPVLEIEATRSVTPGVYSHDAKSLDPNEDGAPQYLCPANIPDALRDRLFDLARRAAEAVGACDVSRVDFRLGADGEPYLLEINTLPGLNPVVSDLCIAAAAEGISYQILVSEILYLAAERFGLRFQPGTLTRPRARTRQKALVPVSTAQPSAR